MYLAAELSNEKFILHILINVFSLKLVCFVHELFTQIYSFLLERQLCKANASNNSNRWKFFGGIVFGYSFIICILYNIPNRIQPENNANPELLHLLEDNHGIKQIVKN